MCYFIRRTPGKRHYAVMRLAGDPTRCQVPLMSLSVSDEIVEVEWVFDQRRMLTLMPDVVSHYPSIRPGEIVTVHATFHRDDVVPVGFSGSARPRERS